MSFFLNSFFITLTSSIPTIFYSPIYDQYWDNTVLLLHGDTAVYQNDIFLDSSNNNFTLTKNGTPTLVYFSPISANRSGSFNGSSYLNGPANAAFNFGTGNFTIECWVRVNNTSQSHGICDTASNLGPQPTGIGRWRFGIEGGSITFYRHGSGGLLILSYAIPSFNTSTWYHIAVSRQNGTNYLFLNGQQVATSTTSVDFNDAGALNIGAIAASIYLNGYISNLRIIKGVGIYTSNFSLPTSPLTLTTNGGATPSTLPTSDQVSLLILNESIPFQNNTFLDSSQNNFTITRNGTPTQGSFSPFGLDLGSINFNGSSNYLTVSGGDVFNFGSSNFTIECWFYANSASTGFAGIFVKGSSGDFGRYTLNMNSSTGTRPEFWINSWGVSGPICGSSTIITDGKWHHLAVVRNNNVFTFYVDGQAGSVTNTWTGSIDDSSATPYIGVDPFSFSRELNALISNLRVTKGAALYTSNFTPPTSHLTLVSNSGATPSTPPTSGQVSLLLSNTSPQTDNFLDTSTYNLSVTSFGNVTSSQSSPFYSASPYYPSVNLGSGYFNGTTDYLTLADSEQFNLSANNFTIECWVNFNSNVNQYYFGQIQSSSTGRSFCHAIIGGKYYFEVRSGSTAYTIASIENIKMNVWTHMAAVRNANTITLYKDGTAIGTVSVAGVTVNNSLLSVGLGGAGAYNSEPLNGYLSNCRIINGTAIYTSNFTPPRSPVTTTSNGGATPSVLPTASQVSLLCDFNNAGIFDSTEKNNLITIGNASLSASQVKYGSGAIAFDGSGDVLKIPHNQNFVFGSSDFTIETWCYITNSTGGTATIFSKRNKANPSTGNFNGIVIGMYNGQYALNITFNGFSWGISTFTISNVTLNTWEHIALVRSGSNFTFYKNGINVYSITNNGSIVDDLTNPVTIGADSNELIFPISGFLDDFRITKGIARYTSNFTPPTRVLPDIPYLGVFALSVNTANVGSTTSTQFNLRLKSSTIYDFDVDWGDGVVETYTSSNTTGYTHTYPSSGLYNVTIAEKSIGGFPGVFYDNTGDRLKLLNITQFGANQFGTNWDYAFRGCENLQILANDFTTAKTQNIKSFQETWLACYNLSSFPLINTSNGQNFFRTWYNCQKITSFPAINTASATNLRQTWFGNSTLKNFPLIQVPNCTSFSGTWSYCLSLTSFPNIDFSNAINFGNESSQTATGIFEACRSISSFDISFSTTRNVSGWDRAFLWCDNLSIFPYLDYSKGTTFYATWMGPNKITTIPSNLTLSAGQNFTQAWRDCRLIKDFPDTYNFSSATNFSYAWYGCNSLSSFPNLSATNATDFSYAWYNCTSLSSIKLTLLAKANGFSQSFNNCNSLRTFELSAPITTSLDGTFLYCTMLTGFDLTAPNVTSLGSTWQNCTNLVNFPTSNINFSKVTNYDSTWRGCSKLIDFPLIDTLSAQNLNQTWMDCTSLTSFPLIDTRNVTNFNSTWQMTNIRHMPAINTSKATSMNQTWWRCYNLISLQPLSTSNVTSFSRTWENCEKLSSFPMIDTSKVTNFVSAWNQCYSLSSFPSIDTSKGTDFSSTWNSLINLSAFPTLDFSNATKMAAAWVNCTGLLSFPWIDTRKVNDTGNGLYSTWANCNKLTTFPAINLSAHTGSLYDCWSNCTSLTSFPYIDISNSTGLGYRAGYIYYTYGTWGNCRKLVTFPALSTGKVTSFNRTWMDCVSLTSFPLIDTSSGTDFTSTWQNCYSLSASEFPTLNMSKMTIGTNCFNGVRLTTTSYSVLLTSLCATNFNNTVTFHGGNSNYNSTVPQVTASRNFLVTPVVNGGRGWTIIDGGPDINIIFSNANQYWYTNFEAGTATKTSGYASSTDVQVVDDNGSVLDTQYYQGTKSYYCNSRTDSNAGLTFVVNPTAFNSTNGFIIDFMVYKVAGDTYPTILGVGLSSRVVAVNQQAFDKNYYSLRWLGVSNGSIIGQSTDGIVNNIGSNTSWGINNNWYRITYYYNNITKYGTVYVDGVRKQTALQERGWNTLPDGNILIGLFNFGTNGESSDNGIEAYIDNLGFYTL